MVICCGRNVMVIMVVCDGNLSWYVMVIIIEHHGNMMVIVMVHYGNFS